MGRTPTPKQHDVDLDDFDPTLDQPFGVADEEFVSRGDLDEFRREFEASLAARPWWSKLRSRIFPKRV